MIYLLTDYKGQHSSKINAIPYKSGMDLHVVERLISKYGHKSKRINFIDITSIDFSDEDLIVFTSSEEPGFQYKEFVDDFVNLCKLRGLRIFPNPDIILANNNKSFMSMISECLFQKESFRIPTKLICSFTELIRLNEENKIQYPIVVKLPRGAMSQNVFLAKNANELYKIYRQNAKKLPLKEQIRELIRTFKYKNYKRHDKYTGRVILQDFIPNLTCDYKVLKFHKYFYLFQRDVRKNDFRASGSGQLNYKYGNECPVPDGIFDKAEQISKMLNVNMLSLDFADNNNTLQLIEYQGIHFGTVGQYRSDICFCYQDGVYVKRPNKLELEELYVNCIIDALEKADG